MLDRISKKNKVSYNRGLQRSLIHPLEADSMDNFDLEEFIAAGIPLMIWWYLEMAQMVANGNL